MTREDRELYLDLTNILYDLEQGIHHLETKKHHSKETREKIALAMKGNKNALGKHLYKR